MVDLKKLEENFNSLFEKETENSFNEWFFEKKKSESLHLLSNEDLIELRAFSSPGIVDVIKPFNLNIKGNSVPNNINYFMAA